MSDSYPSFPAVLPSELVQSSGASLESLIQDSVDIAVTEALATELAGVVRTSGTQAIAGDKTASDIWTFNIAPEVPDDSFPQSKIEGLNEALAAGLQPTATGTTAPSAGGAEALPATPAGYMTVKVNGIDRKIPYY